MGVRKLETNVGQAEVYIRLGWKFIKPFIVEAEGMDWVNEGGHRPAYEQAPLSDGGPAGRSGGSAGSPGT